MINKFILDCVFDNFIVPGETLVTYRFVRKLNRARDTYDFLLILELENNSGLFFEREVLLGTNYRK